LRGPSGVEGSRPDVSFLVMELLEGETLAARRTGGAAPGWPLRWPS
jgi:hypothetical protein